MDERVQYILKTYEYICKVILTQNDMLFNTTSSFQDETNFAQMLSSVEKYAGRRPGETWGKLESRSSYKELVRHSFFSRKKSF